jgi:hypothetical protein
MSHSDWTQDATPRQLFFFAALFAAAGLALAWASYTRHPALRVPPAVGYLVAAVLVAGGAAAAAKAAERPRLVEAFVVAIMAGFAVTGGWIALGDSGAACTTNVALAGAVRAAGCRVAFGVGAIVSAAMAAWAAAMLRQRTLSRR